MIITEIIQSITAIIIAGVAIYGLKEWKKQIRGKTNYEVARRYLKASLELRDAMKYVRNPFIPASEMQSALKEHGFSSDEYTDNLKTNRAVYSVRWKKVQEAWTSLEAESLEAEVCWGSDIASISRPLINLTRELFAELQMYLDGNRKSLKDELIYNTGSDENPDDFSKKVNQCIDKIREFLKPHLLD